MAEKPTLASVTETQCTCGYLQRAADDPDNPIVFEERTGEYQFSFTEGDSKLSAVMVIYHCPFCGGAAPASKRQLLFEVVPAAESERLLELLKPIKTIDDAVAMLGSPDFDDYVTTHSEEDEGAPPVTSFQREIRYSRLSEVAEVCLFDGSDGNVHSTLSGKPISQDANNM